MPMMRNFVHPAVLVTAGFFLVAGVQSLQGRNLAVASCTFLLAAILASRRKLSKVLVRLKYIGLAVTVLFAWQTPGTLIAPALGRLSPTYDGLWLALEPLARLAATAAVVAVMLDRLTAAQWVSSLYVLTTPLRVLGVSPERFAVRLRLVLDFVETRQLDWRASLEGRWLDEVPPAAQCWPVSTLKHADRMALVAMCLLAAGMTLLW